MREIRNFFSYALEIIADIILGLILGMGINTIADYLGDKLNLSVYLKMLVQLILIILVLYVMKIDSRYLYSSWRGSNDYGIVFTTTFLGVQKNVVEFLKKIYNKEF